MKIRKLALAAALALSVSACSGNVPELMDFIKSTPDSVDFEGMTFRLFTDADHDLRYTDEASGASSLRHEKLMERLDQIEDDYNCTIITHCGEETDFSISFGSGVPFADLVTFRLKNTYPMYLGGFYIPLNEISGIDLYSGKYGSDELLESLTWNGDTVAFYPQHWGQGPVGFSDAIVYNPELFTMINQPTPNEYYEQGIWNWDTLKKVGDACVETSSVDNEFYISPSNDYFFRMLVLSNGGEYITENANGKYEYGLLTPEVTEALQFGNDLYKEGYLEKASGAHEGIVKKFGEGKYALMCEYSGFGIGDLISTGSEDLAGEMSALGYCYAPDGPRAVDNTRGVISNENSFYSVTKEKTSDIDTLAVFMEFLFASLDDDPEEWKEEFMDMNFFDEMSAEVYMTKATNSYFDRVIFAFTDDNIFDAIEDAAKNGTISETMQSIASLTNANLDAGINKGKKN